MRIGYSDGSYKEERNMFVFGWIETDTKKEYVEGIQANGFGIEKPSSHIAEYLGIFSFICAHMNEEWELRIDSNLAYNQLMGNWKVRSKSLKGVFEMTKGVFDSEKGIHLKLIKSKDNISDKILRKW